MADAVVLESNSICSQLSAFSLGLNREAGQKGDTVRVTVLSAVEADDFDETTNNYSAGDHTDEGVDIPLSKHKVAKAHYTDREFAESPVDFFKQKGVQCARGLATAVCKDAFSIVTKANFALEADLALAEFGLEKVTQLVTLCEDSNIDPASVSLVLQGVYYSKLMEKLDATRFGSDDAIQRGVIPNLYGFSKIIRAPLLKSAQPGLGGFLCTGDAIGVGMRYLQPQSPKVYEEVGQAYDEASGILYGIRRFGEAATGKNHIAVEALYGRAAVNKKGLIRLIASNAKAA